MNWTFDQVSAAEQPVFRHGEESAEKLKRDFWPEVTRTIREVFGKRNLDEQVEKLRNKVKNADPRTQTAFYHAEPLDVAADLAGQPITIEAKRRYVERILERGPDETPSEADVSWTHPEA